MSTQATKMKVLQGIYRLEDQAGLRLGRNGVAMGLCIVVVLGAGLRGYALDFQSLWTDEISSLMITDPTLPFRQFWDRVLADTHPPIYYLCGGHRRRSAASGTNGSNLICSSAESAKYQFRNRFPALRRDALNRPGTDRVA